MASEKGALDSDVRRLKSEISQILIRRDPLEIMRAAMWYMRTICFMRNAYVAFDGAGEDEKPLSELECNNALLVPEYLQSALVALPRTAFEEASAKANENKETARLFDICDKLIEKCRMQKYTNVSAEIICSDGTVDPLLSFRFEAKLYEDLRGKRYQALEESYLRFLLREQDYLIREEYGICADDVVDGVLALMDSLVLGFSDALEEVRKRQARSLIESGGKAEVASSLRNEAQADDLGNRLFGDALFDVAQITGWPDAIIADLSFPAFSPEGSLEDFNSIDPTGILPIRLKPFIEIDGKSYCFCYANLMDNFYRSFQKALKARSSCASGRFDTLWKEGQTRASEAAVQTLLARLLPGSLQHANVYYPKSSGKFRKDRACEADLVVLYEDCFLSVEVKGAAYCPTDPFDDPDAHVKSLKALIQKAADQAEATVGYVKGCAENAVFYDESGKEVFRFDSHRIREFFKLCVSVDDVNEFAAKAEKLEFLGLPSETVAISLDDLLVYERYFDNPLEFLHFLIQRRRATGCDLMSLNDELDHLGLYIEDNCYSVGLERRSAEEERKTGRSFTMASFCGFRESLNAWFESLYTGAYGEKPIQESPEMFNQLILALAAVASGDTRREVSATLLDFGSETRKSISRSLEIRARGRTPRNAMFELPRLSDGGLSISMFADVAGAPNDLSVCRGKTISSMLSKGESERAMMNITYVCGKIDSCLVERITAKGLSDEDLRFAEAYDDGLRASRKSSYELLLGKKVGRNEPCPCGSGKKYKRCCGR